MRYIQSSTIRRTFTKAFFIFQLLFAFALNSSSQTATAVLAGVVTDEAKAIIPGARLVLKGAGGDTRETVSNDNGEFTFGSLALGKYTLTVTKEGFADVNRAITLDGAAQDASTTLAAGQVSETVTVVMDSAEAAV